MNRPAIRSRNAASDSGPGGRQQAVDRPLDPVRERGGGRLPVRAVAQPPAVVGDPDEAPALGAGERVADEGEQALDVVQRRLGPAVAAAASSGGARVAGRAGAR